MAVIYEWRGSFSDREANDLSAFYYGACGFTPTSAGLLSLGLTVREGFGSRDSRPLRFPLR